MESRRQVLQGLIFSLGGAAALSAFQVAEAKPKKQTKAAKTVKAKPAAFYSPDELALITFLADAIIPRTDTPGAIDAGVPAYMDNLYLTWASEQTQTAHRAQLAAISAKLDRSGDASAQLKALADYDAAAFQGGGNWDYRNVKSLIATVYYLSEPGATQELHYELIPGHWIASAPIAEIGRTWAL